MKKNVVDRLDLSKEEMSTRVQVLEETEHDVSNAVDIDKTADQFVKQSLVPLDETCPNPFVKQNLATRRRMLRRILTRAFQLF
jgi:hypothetical protein